MEWIVSVLLVVGGAFMLLGTIGMVRLPDLLARLHGPSKATTLGIGSLLLASIAYFSVNGEGVSVHELLITLFVTITAPVSALCIARAARAAGEVEASPVWPHPSPDADDAAPGDSGRA